jgi:hypothetical protein
VDQADREQVGRCFVEIDRDLDLVIDDGSHIPEHQRNCLVESVPHIRSGGIYILEDIHSSHPSHPYYRKHKKLFGPTAGSLHVLLAIDHLKRTCLDTVDRENKLDALARRSLFTREEIALLISSIDSTKIYRRADLPDKCWSCGSMDFDYARLQCTCGTKLYAEADSMAALIRVG